jgi:nucleotidyltransferase-like protein
MANPQLVVMAAGIGSRYGGLKQVDPVGPSGEILLDYAVYDARRAGFDKVVFIIRKEIEAAFREKVGRAIESQIDTAYVFQELSALPDGFTVPEGRTKPWGTGHAALTAAGEVTASCAVINADDYYGPSSYQALADFLNSAEDDDGGVHNFCMVGFHLRNTLSEHGHVARGICTASAEGFLEGLVERTCIEAFGDTIRFTEDNGATWTNIDGQRPVSTNIWGFTPAIFDELAAGFPAFLESAAGNPKAEYFLPTVVNNLIQAGRARVAVLPTEEKFYGVTYQEDKPELMAFIASQVAAGKYPEKLWS